MSNLRPFKTNTQCLKFQERGGGILFLKKVFQFFFKKIFELLKMLVFKTTKNSCYLVHIMVLNIMITLI